MDYGHSHFTAITTVSTCKMIHICLKWKKILSNWCDSAYQLLRIYAALVRLKKIMTFLACYVFCRVQGRHLILPHAWLSSLCFEAPTTWLYSRGSVLVPCLCMRLLCNLKLELKCETADYEAFGRGKTFIIYSVVVQCIVYNFVSPLWPQSFSLLFSLAFPLQSRINYRVS